MYATCLTASLMPVSDPLEYSIFISAHSYHLPIPAVSSMLSEMMLNCHASSTAQRPKLGMPCEASVLFDCSAQNSSQVSAPLTLRMTT